ncbi:MAG: hypothetical protein ACETWB_03025 [Anaerolineae bacterium]
MAGQYYFGALTSGTSILEGLIELFLGLFLSRSVGNLLAAFPMLLVGELWASRLGWQWPMWYGR